VHEAIYILVIARATGWAEDYIRWELPQERGWAYFHAARLLDGVPMRWPDPGPENDTWWQRITTSIRKIRHRISR